MGRAYYHTPRVGGEQLSRDLAEAMSMYHEREGRVVVGSTVGEAMIRYEREVLPGKRERTQSGYRIYLRKLENVRRSEIARYVDLRSAKIAANRELSCLSSVFQAAIRWGWCEQNPCLGVPRNRECRRLRLPTDAELAAIRAAAGDQMRGMLIGLRKGDMLKLRLADRSPVGLSESGMRGSGDKRPVR